MLVEEEFSEPTEAPPTTEAEESGEEAGEEISVNIILLEVMLNRLSVLEKLARGEVSPEEAAQMLSAIRAPELEKRRRRRRSK